jgi:hypothetical protein
VDEFLLQVGMIDRRPLSWVSAFARLLSFQRSASEIAQNLVAQQQIRLSGIEQPESLSSIVHRMLPRIQIQQDPDSVATSYLPAA